MERAQHKGESGEKYALQNRVHKYIWWSDGPDEFYDLEADPYETENLIDQPSDAKDRLRDDLLDLVDRLSSDAEVEVVGEETLQGLRAVGYTD